MSRTVNPNDIIPQAPIGIEITLTKLADGVWQACACHDGSTAVVRQNALGGLAPNALEAWHRLHAEFTKRKTKKAVKA